MRAVMIMYDSLNKRYLSPYGNDWVKTPNFQRLAEHSVTFDNFYAGSLPCMPARRELHTGRLNFLHRGWSPCEPFDESMPEILKENGVYSHLITDHCHYWDDGGANYQNRFATFSFVRGQEGDHWIPDADHCNKTRGEQDRINRMAMTREEDHYHVRCFREGRDFLIKNQDKDNWYLQLEYFDPHEPFFVPGRFKSLYTDLPDTTDWPQYCPVDEKDEKLKSYITNYAALVTMCDEYLGKILDVFDEQDLWKDTMLIVNTDHGYFLGEKGYCGKNYMPVYDELANLPFFIHHPDYADADGTRRDMLAQTPDIPVTILEWFGIQKGKHMLGRDISQVIKDSRPIHDAILYGYHGMHINMTDGTYTYMRSAANEDNSPLFQYTLMPWHIAKPMCGQELKQADPTLYTGFEFNDHTPVLKIPVDERFDKKRYYRYSGHVKYGTRLFNRKNDPCQEQLIKDPELEEQLCRQMISLMKENESPKEQYVRVGLAVPEDC
ncbi:MAG: sulfatase [Clostridiaceae bacterium]|nr:sulfatase [Clostridiaceae bacterium]